MWLALALACSEPDPPGAPDPGAGLTTADTAVDGTEPGATETGVTGPLVPLISEALAEVCTPNPGSGGGGGALHRVTLAAAVARCNDGTPPILFVRAANNAALANDWVVLLQGGGRCEDATGCADRWCSETGKMSSAFAGLTRGGAGLQGQSAENTLAGRNHALLYYCTSDQWLGRRRDVVFDDADPPFRLHYDGHEVLVALLDALDAGVTSDDGVQALPSLLGADGILLAGYSGGGIGALHHLDDVAARYPEAQVEGLVDAIAYADPARFDVPGMVEATEAALIEQYDRLMVGLWDAWLDGSCVAGAPEDWHCNDIHRIQLTHVTTRWLLSFDLYDPLIDDWYLAFGASLPDLGSAMSATLRDLAERPSVGVRATACRQHVQIQDDAWYGRVEVSDPVTGAGPLALHEALVDWLAGGEVAVIDDAAGTGSRCPDEP